MDYFSINVSRVHVEHLIYLPRWEPRQVFDIHQGQCNGMQVLQ